MKKGLLGDPTGELAGGCGRRHRGSTPVVFTLKGIRALWVQVLEFTK